jgi:hypothetical protein
MTKLDKWELGVQFQAEAKFFSSLLDPNKFQGLSKLFYE